MQQPARANLSRAEARLSRLLRTGYLPAELPPPFTTRTFGREAVELAGLWSGAAIRKFWTSPEHYSAPRYGHVRRKLSLVNPVNQLHVAHLISENWDEIHRRLQRSQITEFRPAIVLTDGGRAVTGVDFDGVDRRRAQILARFGRYIKTDIARFYPSVYTYSIAWALLGKDWVKQHFATPKFKQSFANYSDKAVAAGQSGQTIGIPIGPDTSRLLSELSQRSSRRSSKEKYRILTPALFDMWTICLLVWPTLKRRISYSLSCPSRCTNMNLNSMVKRRRCTDLVFRIHPNGTIL